MTIIRIQQFHPRNGLLRNLIKYFWVFKGDGDICIRHNILPVNNIDIIINLNSPIRFEQGGVTHETPGNIFFSGLRNTYFKMKQEGRVFTIGVSFFPAGLYPFFQIPMAEFKNRTFGLNDVLNQKTAELEDRLRNTADLHTMLMILEQFFLSLLNKSELLEPDTGFVLERFYASGMSAPDFCGNFGVHPRKLERIFHKYIGTTPKRFLRIQRFLSILSRLTSKDIKSLTHLAHEFDYFDQAHFIKDFKALTGTSPSRFLKEKKSFKQIIKIP